MFFGAYKHRGKRWSPDFAEPFEKSNTQVVISGRSRSSVLRPLRWYLEKVRCGLKSKMIFWKHCAEAEHLRVARYVYWYCREANKALHRWSMWCSTELSKIASRTYICDTVYWKKWFCKLVELFGGTTGGVRRFRQRCNCWDKTFRQYFEKQRLGLYMEKLLWTEKSIYNLALVSNVIIWCMNKQSRARSSGNEAIQNIWAKTLYGLMGENHGTCNFSAMRSRKVVGSCKWIRNVYPKTKNSRSAEFLLIVEKAWQLWFSQWQQMLQSKRKRTRWDLADGYFEARAPIWSVDAVSREYHILFVILESYVY